MKNFLPILIFLASSNAEAQKTVHKIKMHNSVLKSTKTKYNFSADLLNMPTFKKIKISNIEVGFNVPILKDAKKQRFDVGADVGYNIYKPSTYLKPNISYTFPICNNLSIKCKAGTALDFSKNVKYTKESNKKNYSYNPEFISSIGIEPNLKIYQNKNYNVNVFMRYEFASQNTLSAFGQLMHVGINVQNGENSK